MNHFAVISKPFYFLLLLNPMYSKCNLKNILIDRGHTKLRHNTHNYKIIPVFQLQHLPGISDPPQWQSGK